MIFGTSKGNAVSSPPERRWQGLRRCWKLHTWIWPVSIFLPGRSLELRAPRPGPVFRHRTGSGPGGLGAGIIWWQGFVWWGLTKSCSLQIKARKLFHLLRWLTLNTIDSFARGADKAILAEFESVCTRQVWPQICKFEHGTEPQSFPLAQFKGRGSRVTLQSFLELRWSNSNFPQVIGSFLICFVHLHAVPLGFRFP